MATLVYRVKPVPASLRDFIFDFGSLPANTEKMYIRSMVRQLVKLKKLPGFFFFLFLFGVVEERAKRGR